MRKCDGYAVQPEIKSVKSVSNHLIESEWCPGSSLQVGRYFRGRPCPRCGIKMLKSTCASSEEFGAFAHKQNLKDHYEVYPVN